MERPCRSSAMVRIDVPTMDWSSAARNMPSSSPERIVRIWACVYSPESSPGLWLVSSFPPLVRAVVAVIRTCLCGVAVQGVPGELYPAGGSPRQPEAYVPGEWPEGFGSRCDH